MEGTRRRMHTRIKVVGVGGGGGRVVDRVVSTAVKGVETIAVNTDLQALERCGASVKVNIGRRLTRGLGSGGDRTRGRDAAEESRGQLARLVEDADMVLVTGGMGGGTGTGASGVVAELARASGALTIGVVTRPFRFEGRVRNATAESGIRELREKVDALVVIPIDRLTQVVDRKTTLEEAFRIADDVVRLGVQGMTDLIANPGVVNLDFADVKGILTGAGDAWIAFGHGSGASRSEDAARQAVASPLLERPIAEAGAILFTITAGEDVTLHDCQRVAEIVRAAADPAASIVFGLAPEARMRGEMRVTLFASAFGRRPPPGQEPPWPSGVPSSPLPRADGGGAMAWPER